MDARSQRLWLVAACAVALAASHVRAASAESQSSEARGLRVQAERLAARGEMGEALEVARHASRVAPRDAAAWSLLATLQREAGHDHEAEASELACARVAQGMDVCPGRAP